MSDFDPQTEDAIAAMPRAQTPSTFGEVWDANWQAAGVDTMFGQYGPRERATSDLTDAWQRVTGKTPEQSAQSNGRTLNYSGSDQTAAVLGTLAGQLPDEQQKALAPFLDVNARASKYAQDIMQRQADVNDRAFGLSDHAAAWMADMSRQLVDPMNLAGAVVGGPEVGGLGLMLAREFAVNAGFGALQHVETSAEKQRLGLPEGSIVEDALSAGLFGTAIGLGMRAAGYALRRAVGDLTAPQVEGFAEKPAPTGSPVTGLDPGDFEAAARLQARNVAMDALAPGGRDAVNAAAARLETEDTPLTSRAPSPDAPPPAEAVQHPGLDDAIDAFHGTPHEFLQFQSSAIGTGEGAQAFGPGLYFAERRGVAEWYRDQLGGEGGGNLYQVKVTSPRDSFIQWDQPLAAQAPRVRSAIEGLGYHEDDLARLKADLQSSVSGRALAAQLGEQGVSGVRYLDAVSRRAGRGTSNLVVFNDKDILVTHRNDEPIFDAALRESGTDPATVPQAVRDRALDIMVHDKITHPMDALQRAMKELDDEARAGTKQNPEAGRYDGVRALDGGDGVGEVQPSGLAATREASSATRETGRGQGGLETRIHDAYLEASGGKYNERVFLNDIRDRLPDVAPAELNAALGRMHLDAKSGVELSGSDNPLGDLTRHPQGKAREAAGFAFKGEDKYALWMQHPIDGERAAPPSLSAEAGAGLQSAPAEGFPGDEFPTSTRPRDAAPVKPAFREPSIGKPPTRPQSLLAFLKNKGGLKNQGGELRDYIKQYPGLVDNKNGLNLDRAREAAAEAGYLGGDTRRAVSETTPDDLLTALRKAHEVYSVRDADQIEGSRQYEEMKARRDDIRSKTRLIEFHADEAGLGAIDPEHLWTAAELMHDDRGLEWDNALERGAIMLEGRDHDLAQPKRTGDVAGSESGAGARQGDAGGGDRSRPESAVADARRQVRDAGETATEAGPEGTRQTLIDGVAPVSDRERLQAQANRPLRGGDKEPPAGGLFDQSARVQMDMFDLAPQRADVERALAKQGGDAQVMLPDGSTVSARQALSSVDEFKTAAKELAACILKFGE